MTCFALNKMAKDSSLVAQDFKIGGELKRWGNAVYKSILRSISPYSFPFGKYVFVMDQDSKS